MEEGVPEELEGHGDEADGERRGGEEQEEGGCRM